MTTPEPPDAYARQLAAELAGWAIDTSIPGTPGAIYLTHPDGHRLGLRLQPHGHGIQTWITAGPLPELPAATTPSEAAKAQTALDARLQPGRTWHAVLNLSTSTNPYKALLTLATKHLIRALTVKPKHAATAPKWREKQPLPRARLTRLPKPTTRKDNTT
ncbi:hypothetical protein OH807_18330 [Kitasatospora sp. NBC_01560]|uniref:hypothetical protein n=1 Tax=Kitasatospora sp. NBC_01560 TaxID=2975965 RepID=UPI00386C99B2